MWLAEKKLAARLRELESYRYRDRISLSELDWAEDVEGRIGARPPVDAKWQSMPLGSRWKGRDRYLWLRANVDVPASWKGRQPAGRFQFGRNFGGNLGGFESLLYLDGSPFQGVGHNHQEVILPSDSPGRRLELAFRLWSGHEFGGPQAEQEHAFEQAEICWIDESADDLYY